MKSFILTILLITTTPSWSKQVSESMTVVQMNWSKERSMYRLTMQKHAAVYWGTKEVEQCLLASLHQKKSVQVSFNPQNLVIKSCTIR